MSSSQQQSYSFMQTVLMGLFVCTLYIYYVPTYAIRYFQHQVYFSIFGYEATTFVIITNIIISLASLWLWLAQCMLWNHLASFWQNDTQRLKNKTRKGPLAFLLLLLLPGNLLSEKRKSKKTKVGNGSVKCFKLLAFTRNNLSESKRHILLCLCTNT